MSDQGLISALDDLVSEGRNSASIGIDKMSTRDVLNIINQEDAGVPGAVQKILPNVSRAVDRIVEAFEAGGRLIYIGAGTSGRLGVLDASECPPTFSVPEGMVVGIIAGGSEALVTAVEGIEDDEQQGATDLRNVDVGDFDVVVGIAASGRTPYVLGGLKFANEVGATTVALSCNPNSIIEEIADIAIVPIVGPEVLTGSTRMKSGTAQKLVLNMLTTASMIRIGKSYQNLMVDVSASNRKLHARATNIVMQATGCTVEEATAALGEAKNSVKLAILTTLTGLDVTSAEDALRRAKGFLRTAINSEG